MPQAYSPALPVGMQRNYKQALAALSAIVREEGVRGLARGVGAPMLRATLGSSVRPTLRSIIHQASRFTCTHNDAGAGDLKSSAGAATGLHVSEGAAYEAWHRATRQRLGVPCEQCRLRGHCGKYGHLTSTSKFY